jgi:hypothetical protein
MAKKSITKNYIYNVAYQILITILPLITTPYVSRVLNAEAIGIYSYTISITTYFILFGSLGVALYGQREIAYYQTDKMKRSKIFWEINILRFVTMTIAMVIYYFIYVRQGEYKIYYEILLIELLANCLDISWFFRGIEEFKKTVVRNTIVKLISVALIFTLVKSVDDLYKYFIIYVLSTAIGNISLWLYLPKYIEKVKINELNILKHLKPTIILFIPQIAVQIYTVLDKTMIGMIVSDKAEVGYYEQSQKIIKLLLSIITSLGTVMLPRMAATFANGDNDKMKEYMKKSFNFVFLLAFPMIIGIDSVASKFVPLFFGNGYEKVTNIIYIISPIILAIGLSNVVGTQYLLPTKRQKEYTISVICGAIINFILNMILIRMFRSLGASIATVIAEFSVTAIQLFAIRKDMNIKKIVNLSKKYLVSTIVMGIVVLLIGFKGNNSWTTIIIQGISGMVTYLVMLIILKDEFLLDNINKILKVKK